MNELNSKRNLAYLYDLQTQNKSQQLSDSEFFDAVGETFRLNPEFFMKELYNPFRKKMGISIGAEKLKEMGKYIIEKFCLGENEEILYECKGKISLNELLERKPSGKYKMVSRPVKLSVSSGNLFFTNYRIIAQGKLKVTGGYSTNIFSDLWPTLLTRCAWMGDTIQAKRRKDSFKSSPVFGYIFQIKNHTRLGKINLLHIVGYSLNIDKRKCDISIKPTDTSKREEHLNKIFDLLRQDANEVLDVINEVYETELLEKNKRRMILVVLKALRKSEEFADLSDSDFLNIVKETYKLDPEFFMNSVYPKMISWKFPSFLSVKEELIEHLRKEGANIN